jgi:hypothetical protein
MWFEWPKYSDADQKNHLTESRAPTAVHDDLIGAARFDDSRHPIGREEATLPGREWCHLDPTGDIRANRRMPDSSLNS